MDDKDVIIACQQKQIDELHALVAQLRDEIVRLKKNSSNSSKPPSSDIVKPPRPAPPRGKKRRRIGGQPGHSRQQREPFGPEDINTVQTYTLESCPQCGGVVQPAKRPPRVLQQVEIPVIPREITEHRGLAYWCPRCRKLHYAPLPDDVRRAGLVGPRLTALVAYLKGSCHASYSTIRTFCRDVLRLNLSRGQLAKLVARSSEAMADAYEQLRDELPNRSRLNVDETGHKDNGRGHWTWCFRADAFTLFHIDPSRGSEVLVNLLGEEFNGVLGCDYFSAYRKYMADFDVLVQFCLAHLIRDVKFLTQLPNRVTANYGRRVLKGLRRLFGVIHRRESMTPAGFQRALQRARESLLDVAKRPPPRREAQNLAERFRKHGRAYFQFITTPDVEPTNNLAEQAIRFVVMDRHVTQGTRSPRGRQWCQRIWTAIATCRQQERSVFEYLHQSITSHLQNTPTPSLLPATP